MSNNLESFHLIIKVLIIIKMSKRDHRADFILNFLKKEVVLLKALIVYTKNGHFFFIRFKVEFYPRWLSYKHVLDLRLIKYVFVPSFYLDSKTFL